MGFQDLWMSLSTVLQREASNVRYRDLTSNINLGSHRPRKQRCTSWCAILYVKIQYVRMCFFLHIPKSQRRDFSLLRTTHFFQVVVYVEFFRESWYRTRNRESKIFPLNRSFWSQHQQGKKISSRLQPWLPITCSTRNAIPTCRYSRRSDR